MLILEVLTSLGYGILTCIFMLGAPWVIFKHFSQEADYPYYWSLPLAIVSGFWVTYTHMLNLWWVPFPPTDSTQWVFFWALPTLLLALLKSRKNWGLLKNGLAYFGLTGGITLLILWPLLFPKNPELIPALWWGYWVVWTLGFTLMGSVLEKFAQADTSPLTPALLANFIGCLSIFIMWGYSASLSQLALALALLMGVVFILNLSFTLDLSRGVTSVVYVPLCGIIVSAYHFAELPAWSALLLVSWLAWFLPKLPWFQARKKWIAWVMALGSACCLNALCLGAYYWLFESALESSPYY